MLDFDLSAEIQALRATFADIQAVVDVDALRTEIARLSDAAGAPISGTTRMPRRR